MNPFGMEKGPSGPSSPSGPSGRGQFLHVEAPSSKGETKGGLGFETRRAELKPDVRKYADRMHARLLDIYKKYGAKDASGLRDRVLGGKAPKLEKKDVEEIERLLDALDQALMRNMMPSSELPGLEIFEETIEKINQRVAPQKVLRLGKWEDYECIDGKLNGIVTMDSMLQLPVIDGELVFSVKNKEGEKIGIYQTGEAINTDGKLTGCVTLADGTHHLVVNEVIIDELSDSEGNAVAITSAKDIEVIDGKVNCQVWLLDGRNLPVIDGVVITTVKDEKSGEERRIYGCGDVRNVDGKLNGHVQFTLDQNPRLYPVIGGKFIEKITDRDGRERQIYICYEVRNIGGRLNGIIKLMDDVRYLPIINGEIIESVEDEHGDVHAFQSCSKVRNVNGGLNCCLELENSVMLPVVDGILLDSVKDRSGHVRRIEKGNLRKVNGELFGAVELSPPDSRILPVIDGKLVEEIEYKEIWGLFEEGEYSDAGGVVSGDVLVLDQYGERVVRRVLLGKFID